MSEARVTEIKISFGGDGKVAIVEYGKVSSGWHASLSRTYEIPEDWDEHAVEVFELDRIEALKAQIEPVLQHEHDWRYAEKEW